MAKKKNIKTAAKKGKRKKRLSHTSDVPNIGVKQILENIAEKKKVGFQKGNSFWEVRSVHGKDKIFTTPQAMWEAAMEYFKWCLDNPLHEHKLFHADGRLTSGTVPKLRAYTWEGLCHFMHVNTAYFRNFKIQCKDDTDYSAVIAQIEEVIKRQKFEAAAADLLNANIISRDLGLADRLNVEDQREQVGSLFPEELK